MRFSKFRPSEAVKVAIGLRFGSAPRNLLLASINAQSAIIGLAQSTVFLTALRWLICCGIVLRFIIHWHDYDFINRALILSLIAISLIVAIYCQAVPTKYLVHYDVFSILGCYILTLQVESDFYLFLLFPYYLAAKTMSLRWMLYVFVLVTLSLFSAISITFMLHNDLHSQSFLGTLLRVFVPREIFFVVVLTVVASMSELSSAALADGD